MYQKFGVLYSVKYLSEFLKNLGFSYQKARLIPLKSYGKISKKMKFICIISQLLILSSKKSKRLFHILFIDKRRLLDFWGIVKN
ncbi:winged helix-turn-helix domain-containing protein [Desulfobacter sp.]|uniref:winged helix-turn-helix domain-containing protein n=1 Tax=Desulfobacter sp. TaxID=2294 RepID=UPI003D0FF12D